MYVVGVLLRLPVERTTQEAPPGALKVPMKVSWPGPKVPTVAFEPFNVPVTEPVQVLLIGVGR